jgi:hypothetical protein
LKSIGGFTTFKSDLSIQFSARIALFKKGIGYHAIDAKVDMLELPANIRRGVKFIAAARAILREDGKDPS